MKEGRPKYCYNFYGVDLFHVESTERVPRRHAPASGWTFEYDGGGRGEGRNGDAVH